MKTTDFVKSRVGVGWDEEQLWEVGWREAVAEARWDQMQRAALPLLKAEQCCSHCALRCCSPQVAHQLCSVILLSPGTKTRCLALA